MFFRRILMKKKIRYAILILALLIPVACTPSRPPEFPELGKTMAIEITSSEGEGTKRIRQADRIERIVTEIEENREASSMKSLNDQPTNVDRYFMIRFFSDKEEEKTSETLYLYKKKGRCYVERPYAGIWTIKNESYDTIISLAGNDNT